MSEYINCDCMDLMARYLDKHFDLAIVDPPYGVGAGEMTMGRGSRNDTGKNQKRKWDTAIPGEEYFKELFRTSKNQIIWGGNYFPLPPSRCFLIWDKLDYNSDFASAELAWASFDRVVKTFQYPRNKGEVKIHPTQKPVALYKWLLKNYAKPGWLILDTHVGSASSLIACEDMGFDYVGCELDPDYYRDSCERIKEFRAQPKLILDDKEEILESGLLF